MMKSMPDFSTHHLSTKSVWQHIGELQSDWSLKESRSEKSSLSFCYRKAYSCISGQDNRLIRELVHTLTNEIHPIGQPEGCCSQQGLLIVSLVITGALEIYPIQDL